MNALLCCANIVVQFIYNIPHSYFIILYIIIYLIILFFVENTYIKDPSDYCKSLTLPSAYVPYVDENGLVQCNINHTENLTVGQRSFVSQNEISDIVAP